MTQKPNTIAGKQPAKQASPVKAKAKQTPPKTSRNLSIIAKGAMFIFCGFAISKLLAYIYRVIIARFLGPENFGILSIGLALQGIIIVFAALGLYQGLLHFIAVYDSTGKKERVRGTILGSFALQFSSAIGIAIIFFLLSDYIAITFFRIAELSIVLKILAFSIPFEVLTSNLMIITQAFKKIEYKVLLRNIIENLFKISFTLALLWLGFGLYGATFALLAAYVLAFFIAFAIIQKKVYPILSRGLSSSYNLRELFSYSWPLFAVGFFAVLMTSIDSVMLGSLTNAYNVGIYNVAAPTAHILEIPGFAFASLFLPIVTGLFAQKKMQELGATYKTVTRWIFTTVFPAMLFTVLFARGILATMFGAEYASGDTALAILAVGIFLVSFFGPVRSMLESIAKTRWILYNTIIAAILNICLNITLIPMFGIKGAALATSLSFFFWNMLAWLEVYYTTRIHPYSKAYLKPTIAGCIAIAVFYLIKQLSPAISELIFPINLALLLAFGTAFVALHFFLFVVLRGLQPADLEILRSIEKKTGFKSNLVRNFVKRFI